MKGGSLDDDLKSHFNEITTIILSNQTEALRNLTEKVTTIVIVGQLMC
jgi:hypothetical protein